MELFKKVTLDLFFSLHIFCMPYLSKNTEYFVIFLNPLESVILFLCDHLCLFEANRKGC